MDARDDFITMYRLTSERCTLTGDIFPKAYLEHLSSCHLRCRDTAYGFPSRCAWQAEFKAGTHPPLTEEQQERFRTAFDIVDSDDDGRVTAQELLQCLDMEYPVDLTGHMRLPLDTLSPKREALFTSRFAALDRDNSTALTLDEFLEGASGFPEWTRRRAIETLYLTLTNFAWIPAFIWAVRRRLIVEPFAIASFCLMVLLYHLCRDGAVCLHRYDLLFFLDASCATYGILLGFYQTAGFSGRWRTAAPLISLTFACIMGWNFVVHTDPGELLPYRVGMFVLGLGFLAVRYIFLDRRLPRFNWRNLLLGWALLLSGVATLALLQMRLPYWIAHGSWHVLAAVGGYLLMDGTYPAGFMAAWTDEPVMPKKRKAA